MTEARAQHLQLDDKLRELPAREAVGAARDVTQQLHPAEQSRAEQSRAEQSRAEQSRAEQSRAEQSRAETGRAEQEGGDGSRKYRTSTHQTKPKRSCLHLAAS
jgi:hypothetical protein